MVGSTSADRNWNFHWNWITMKELEPDMKFWLVPSLAFMILASACTSFDRHPGSGYQGSSNPKVVVETDSTFQKSKDSSLASPTRIRLKQLENAVRTNKEVEQYSKVLPYMKDENERIEFLELPDYEARQNWLQSKNFADRSKQTQAEMQPIVEAADIAVGMPQILVKKSWGEPENVEVSGNPQFRNEKWRYSKYVSTAYGYKLEKKHVYFEAGKVVGWETE